MARLPEKKTTEEIDTEAMAEIKEEASKPADTFKAQVEAVRERFGKLEITADSVGELEVVLDRLEARAVREKADKEAAEKAEKAAKSEAA